MVLTNPLIYLVNVKTMKMILQYVDLIRYSYRPIVCDYIDNFSITVDDNIPKIFCSALTFAGQLPHNRFKEICRIRFAILFSILF